MARRGADVLVETLAAQGVSHAFGVPGESFLAVLDALHDGAIRFVICRQEGGAAFAAEAWGKLTGRPGIAFVTRGPGATNAAIGVHTAMQGSSPMILFVGQVARGMKGREAFQELDYRQLFGGVAKWATEIDSADRVPEIVARAVHVALSGRPGPVVVALPEDMLVEETTAPPMRQRLAPRWPAADPAAVRAARDRLALSDHPAILVGGGGWDGEGRGGRAALDSLTRFAEVAEIPVVTAFRWQDLVDNNSPVFVGDAGVGMPAHVRRVLGESDVVLALNIRFGETVTDGYTLWQPPEMGAHLIHVHPSDAELGKVYQTADAHHASPADFAAQLAALELGPSEERRRWRSDARRAFAESFELPEQPGTLDMGAVMGELRRVLPDDAILTNGAGNFAIWPTRQFLFGPGHRLLGPQAGAMGAGLPAAVAAGLAAPGRRVVCFAGDGDLQMTMQELGTALQEGVQPVVLVVNNGTYGTIRMHQEREFPGRVSGTDLMNPDFTAIGRAYGMHAERVTETADFPGALARAMESQSGALLELVVDAEAITPRTTLAAIRAAARGHG
jgi:acetolactate synthase-1/2/3 large subunit